MTQDNASGQPWDAAGGLPDPFVKITINGTLIGMTSTKQDTLTPAWNEEFTTAVNIPAGSTLLVDVEDSDLTVNDPMFSCQGTITADYLRIHGSPYIVCPGFGPLAAAQVRFYFMPQ